MSQAGAYILIKLLSGPNAGAEMELAPGDWILGSDEDSQLLILDAGVAPQHLLLHVGDSGDLTLLPKNGSALVDGAPLPVEGAIVPHFAVFTVGGTHISHGPADAVWPELSLPSLVSAASAIPGQETGDSEAPSSASPAASESGAEKVGTANPAPTREATNVGGHVAKKPGGLMRWVLPAIVLLLLLGLGLDYTHFGLFFSDHAREASAMEKNLHRRGFAHVAVTAKEDGTLLVKGSVPSNATLDALVHYVERSGKRAEMSIVSLEDLVEALQAKAKRLDAPLRVTRTGPMLRISGYVYDMLALEEVLEDERDALAAVPVRLDVTTWEKAAKEIRGMIIARSLDAKVRALPDIYRVTLQAQPLSVAEQQALRSIMREAEDLFGVEGVLSVERWRVTQQTTPRPAQPAKTMALAPTEPTAQPQPVRVLVIHAGRDGAGRDETAAAQARSAPPTSSAGTENSPATAPEGSGPERGLPPEVREGVAIMPAIPTSGPSSMLDLPISPDMPDLPTAPDMPTLVAQQPFSCSQLFVVGEGHNMAVIYGGVRYKTGAKMPDNLQVKVITPGYVVLQRGKTHTRICTAGETAKETRP